MVVDMPSGCMPPRSTNISCSSQAGLPEAVAFQRGSSLKVNCEVSIWPLRPSGHTTRSSYCSSLCTWSWWSQLQASMEGAPSVMVLMWPMLDRCVCDRTSFNWMKAYTQSLLPSLSSMSLHTVSARVV